MSPREDSGGDGSRLITHQVSAMFRLLKNTAEAAALVCAKHISSKSLGSSAAPHLDGKVSPQPIASAGGSPVDTGHFIPVKTHHCCFFRLVARR